MMRVVHARRLPHRTRQLPRARGAGKLPRRLYGTFTYSRWFVGLTLPMTGRVYGPASGTL